MIGLSGRRRSAPTGLFLHLYVPNLVAAELKPEDFHAPKLLVVRGSPGSGKSSLLRLFQVETLIALARSAQANEQAIVDRLRQLEVWDDDGPRAVGVYMQCDSNLRDLANVDALGANTKLLNTLLDVRIVLAFLRALGQLPRFAAARQQTGSADALEALRLKPLPPDDGPAPLFATERTVGSFEQNASEWRPNSRRCSAVFRAIRCLPRSAPIRASSQSHFWPCRFTNLLRLRDCFLS